MCGIFGYVGKSTIASDLVLEGLKILEYRGYDSWGVAVIDNSGKFDVTKAPGKIGKARIKSTISQLGIGHTRWATHGGVTVENAHPHLSCDSELALIHNGIVENFKELRGGLSKKHKFLSETDTEVIIHMVEEEYPKLSLANALEKVFKKLKGLNAIAVASSTGEIAVAKNGSPLVIGISSEGLLLASDATALLPHTKKVVFLEDNQLASLKQNGLEITDLESGEKKKPLISKLDWVIDENQLGNYKHYLLKEIHEQPKVLRNIANTLIPSAKELSNAIKNAKGTFLIGSGTAFYACLAGAYLFSRKGIHVNTTPASEFVYLQDFLKKESLVIALSQSGETIDVLEPLNFAKKKGSKIAAVVNALGSSIYRLADIKILLGAGPELAVASTKAYTAKIALLILVAASLDNNVEQAKKLLLSAASEVERLLKPKSLKQIKEIAKVLSKREHIYVIGRGLSYALALETSMKMKEVSYIHTEGLPGGELKHGTIALIDKGTPVIVYTPNDETLQSIISNATEIKSRGGLIIGIGPKNSDVFDHWIKVADIGEASLIPMIVPAQLFGYYLALEKGYDPDKPRNLAKSVTVK
jgi:glucosamine--fructose-6-phosphate aminotransferase (isomerizing)